MSSNIFGGKKVCPECKTIQPIAAGKFVPHTTTDGSRCPGSVQKVVRK